MTEVRAVSLETLREPGGRMLLDCERYQACPNHDCATDAGEPCRTKTGNLKPFAHLSRQRAYRGIQDLLSIPEI